MAGSDGGDGEMTFAERKFAIYNRLRREGRWKGEDGALLFKDKCFEELKAEGIRGDRAQQIVWSEIERRFPPLPPRPASEPEKAEESESEESEEEEVMSEEDVAAIESMVEGENGKSSGSVNLMSDIRWVYSQLENKKVKAKDAPTAGAWSLLQWARKYQSRFFEQLLPKALAKDTGAESDIEKREAEAIEDINDMLRRLAEAKDDE